MILDTLSVVRRNAPGIRKRYVLFTKFYMKPEEYYVYQ